MRLHRTAFWCIVALALVAGAAAWRYLSFSTEITLKNPLQDSGSFFRHMLDPFFEIESPQNREPVPHNAADILRAVKEDPDTLWLIWHSWSRYQEANHSRTLDKNTRSLLDLPADNREWADESEEFARFAAERDPDNAYPLFMLAYLEAAKGITMPELDEEYSPVGGAIIYPEHAEAAVRLLHEAAGKKHMTFYDLEAARSLLRSKEQPGTGLEALALYDRIYACAVFPNLLEMKMTRDRLLTETKRRLKASNGNEASALRILSDLQTLGSMMVADSSTILSFLVGYATICDTTEEGTRLLRDYGLAQEADELLARGRVLARPYLVSYRSQGFLETYPLLFSPELLAETKQAPSSQEPTYRHSGMVIQLMAPYRSRFLDQGDLYSAEELYTATRMEYWMWEKTFWSFLITCVAILLSAAVVMYILQSLLNKNATVDTAIQWPPGRQVAIGSLLFAGAAALPGLMAAFRGHDATRDFVSSLEWLAFCNLWGTLAAFALLHGWIRRAGRETVAAEGEQSASRRGGLWSGLVPIFVVVAGIFAAGCFVALQETPIIRLWDLDIALFIGILAIGIIVLLRWLIPPGWFGASGPISNVSTRLLLGSVAGGILLWAAAYLVMDHQERSWGKRDTLVIPRDNADFGLFGPMEGRLIGKHREQMRQTLAELEPR